MNIQIIVAATLIAKEFLSSDEDDDFVLECVAGAGGDPVPRIKDFINIVLNYSALQFQQSFRLSRAAFEAVLRDITPFMQDGNRRRQTSVEKQLMAVVWIMATPESYRSVGERFDMPKSTLSASFVRILNAINAIAGRYIKWPTAPERANIKMKFGSSAFPNVIGAMDGTFIRLKVPHDQVKAYTNRKCYTAMTLQGICDSEMRFIDCYTGWPSSVPDVRVFKNSDLYQKCQVAPSEYFSSGEYILGDKAYPCLSWCMPPFIRRRPLTTAQKQFNKKHASVRSIIENCWALLFGRFRRLRDLDMSRMDWVPATILACCVLHNVCLEHPDDLSEEHMTSGQSNVEGDDGGADVPDRGEDDGMILRDQICANIQ